MIKKPTLSTTLFVHPHNFTNSHTLFELNYNEPYVEISTVSVNSAFVAKKAKMYEEEKEVAQRVALPGTSLARSLPRWALRDGAPCGFILRLEKEARCASVGPPPLR